MPQDAPILLVDDDSDLREGIAAALTTEGYEVICAEDGHAALALAGVRRPALILLDMRMPVLDGWQFAHTFRETPPPHAPIVVLTASANAADWAESIGAADVLAKPFAMTDLFAVVRRHVPGLPAIRPAAPEGRPSAGLPAGDNAFLELFSGVTEAMLVADANLRTIDANAAATALFERRRSDLLRSHLPDLLTDEPARAEAIAAALLNGGAWQGSVERPLRDRPRALLEVRVNRIELPDGNVFVVVARELDGSGQPTSSRDALYRVLFERNPNPMWVYDQETLAFLAVNDAAVAEYGYSREEFLAMTIKELRPPEHIPRLLEQVDSIAGRRSDLAHHRRRDGSLLDVEVTGDSIVYDGRPARLVVATNVTARIQAETALQERVRLAAFSAAAALPLTRDDTLPVLLARCVEAMVEHLDAALACIWTIDPETQAFALRACAGAAAEPERRARAERLRPALIEPVVAGRRPYVTNDLPVEAAGLGEEWPAREGIASFAAVPLIVEERVLGVVALAAPAPLSEATIEAIQSVAGAVALGIERRRSRAAVARAEARYRNIFEYAPHGIFQADLDGRIRVVNPAAARLLGYPSPDAVLARRPRFLEAFLGRDQWLRLRDAVLGGDGAASGECRLRRRDGTLIWASIDAHPLRDESDAVIGIEGFATDTTARHDVETALRDSQAQYQRIVETAREGIRILDTENRVTFVNQSMAALIGLPAEQIIGRSWFDFLTAAERPRAAERIEANRLGRPLQSDVELRRGDGTSIWTLMSSNPLFDDQGAYAGTLAMFTDITERRLAEESMRAREIAEAANHAKSDFLSRMSHELRTPLNAILGFAQLLAMDELPPDQAESVQHINSAGKHLLNLINEVLDITRIETNSLPLSVEPIAFREAIAEAIDLMQPLATAQDVRIEVGDGAQVTAWVRADRQRVKQILLNLLSNAVKYGHEGGRVRVDLRPAAGGAIRLEVTDYGRGIAPEMQERLFTPFDRLGAEQTAIEGTGLGLALTRRLVEAMGGRVGVESAVGRGSTFWVELPAVEPPGRVAANGPASELTLDVGPASKTILYIEDNLSNLKLIQVLLSRWPILKLLPAMQGRLGLDLAREHRPSLILLDLHLPDMSGVEVLRQLKVDLRTRAIPVVMISADATHGQVERLLAAGAHAYLTKPLDVERFLSIIQAELTAPPGSRL